MNKLQELVDDIHKMSGIGKITLTERIQTLLISEVEKYYIQGYMDSFEPDNGEMPDGSLSTRQINIMTKQAKEKLEQHKALSDIGGKGVIRK